MSVILAMLVASVVSFAQGTISGKVTSSSGNGPIAGARIKVVSATDASMVRGAFTNNRGSYEVKNLAKGSYTMTVSCIGYRTESVAVSVGSDDVTKNVSMDENITRTEDVVVSASRRAERALDAPASVSVVSAADIQARPTLSAAEQLRGITGVDIVQKGIGQNEIAVRGFSNVFSGSVLTLTDYRMSSVPSLRANISYFVPATVDDLERVEVVRGPGSALFGPNVTQGVVNMITRSPFASKGTSVSVAMGNQALMNLMARHAGTIGDNLGYKISAQYLSADDWAWNESEVKEEANALATAKATGVGDTNLISKRIQKHERFSADARVDYNISDRTAVSLSTGVSQLVTGIEMTDLGAGQGKDWRYTYANAQVNSGDLMAQLTYNMSDAGSTYLLRTGNPIVDKSTLMVGRLQHAYSPIADWNLTYGADVFMTNPVTDGTINGKNEDSDNINEYGAYLQSNYGVIKDKLNFLATVRFDKHSQLADPMISPRAALLYKLNESNSVRVTFNRAFSTPSTNDLFLALEAKKNILVNPATGQPINPAWKLAVRALGAGETGFTFERDANGNPYFYSPQAGGAKFTTGDATGVWNIAKGIVAAGINANPGLDSNTKRLLTTVIGTAPQPQTVAAVMALLNPSTGKFTPTTTVKDVERLRPTVNQTIEFGYTGNVGSGVSVSADVYYSEIKDFIGSQQVMTPNVFFAAQGLDAYYRPILQSAISGSLQQKGLPKVVADSIANVQAPVAAAQIAGGFAQVSALPLGTVSPTQSPDRTAITLGPRNYGDVTLLGIDLATEWKVNRMLTLRGTASIMNIMGDSADSDQNIYRNLDGISDLALNAPKFRGALSANYRADEGYSVGVQGRWNGGFEMNSGVYIGQINPYWLLDLQLSYKLPFMNGVTAFFSMENMLDNKVSQFIGAAPIGRLMTGRLTYNF
ncbi:MAG: TonB-dependent receptor [Candidatus Kapaibacterium sp.]